jgi:hypothetical protein
VSTNYPFELLALFPRNESLTLENTPILKILCESLELLINYFQNCELNMAIDQFACTIFLYLPCEQSIHTFLYCLKCWEGRNGVNCGKRGFITRGKDISNPFMVSRSTCENKTVKPKSPRT